MFPLTPRLCASSLEIPCLSIKTSRSSMSIMPLYLIVWSLQKGSPLKMTASTLKNFRLSKILLVKIYNYCNRANIHRGMVFLLLFQKHKWFPAAGAASEKNQPVSVICQWTFPLHAGWGFQSDCERPQFCLWAYMTKDVLFNIYNFTFSNIKKGSLWIWVMF